MDEELTRYRDALEVIAQWHVSGFYIAGEMKKIAIDALNPLPKYEDVEVKRWMVSYNGKENYYDREPTFEEHAGCEVTLLSAKVKRPVNRKVRKREEIIYENGMEFVTEGNKYRPMSTLPLTAKKYVIWEE